MSTQQPSPSSPNDQDSKLEAIVAEVHEKLRKEGVEPGALAVVRVSDQEMLIGEVFDHEKMMADGPEAGHGSVMEERTFLGIKNPRLIIRRVLTHRETGALKIESVFSDYDMVDEGYVEVRPMSVFFLDWMNWQTQLNYCGNYLGFLEGRKLARAEAAAAAAGIKVVRPDALQNLQGNYGRG
jgi:hypothetical protein